MWHHDFLNIKQKSENVFHSQRTMKNFDYTLFTKIWAISSRKKRSQNGLETPLSDIFCIFSTNTGQKSGL